MHRYWPLLVALLVLTSCGSDTPADTTRRTTPTPQVSIRIKSAQGETVSFGDTIRFIVEPVDASLVIEEITVSAVDSRSVLFRSTQGKVSIPTAMTGGGNLRLKVEASFGESRKGTRYKDYKVLAAEAPRLWNFEVVQKYPHSTSYYTQGLLIHNGMVYEGTGQYGESRIVKYELKSGKVHTEYALPADVFGEGITVYDGKIYQLTYKGSRGYIYDAESLEPKGEFSYNFNTSEGWGLTHNDTALIASDGSGMLYFLNPATLEETGRLRVFSNLGEVTRLNELEYRNGTIYANIYTQSEIVAIDASTGRITDVYTARGMVEKAEAAPNMDVLNGIAINPMNGNMLLTGKYWSRIYEVRPVPRADA